MLIKDIAIFNPKGLKAKDYINYIDTSSVEDGKLGDIQKLHSDFPSRAQRVILKNDILISSVRPNLKHNYFVNYQIENGVASTGFIQIRVIDKNVLPQFLYYFLTTENKVKAYQNIAETSQSTFPSFNKDVIENLDFPNISLEDQQHIVDILGSIDEKIELLAKENEKIEKYANHLFDIFSEKAIQKIKLKDIVLFANTGADAIQKAPIVDYDTGIRCARVGDFSNDRPLYEWGFCNTTHELFSQYQLKQNDILITRTATLGLAKFIDEDVQAVYNNGLIRLKINNEIAYPKYVYRVLKSKDFIAYIAGIEGASSTRPNMKINYLLEYKFNILSMDCQQKFNHYYSDLREKQNHNQNAIYKLNELKQLYLKKFFG